MKTTRRHAVLAALATATAGLAAMSGMTAASASAAFIGPLHTVTQLTSTVPANGDVNPYGTAVVPHSTGDLHQGSVLVSNFNDKANVQGTGTTIVQVTPGGTLSLFAQIDPQLHGCPGGVGLTTALVVLRSGWVIVGSLPTRNGSVSGSGCLIVLDSHGMVRETFAGQGINGPWDMTALDQGNYADLFVTNVLNGTVAADGGTVDRGTVLRLVISSSPTASPRLLGVTTIGSGFPEMLNSSALVIGPTGVGLGSNGTLYVADTLSNRIAAIPSAVSRGSDDGTGQTVSQGNHLSGELGLAIAPNGDILTVNGGNGNIVEVTPGGAQVAVRQLDSSGSPPGAGALFGLAVKPGADAVYFVDDATNTLNLFH
ncbi:MAG: hypothetical protein JO132_17875 [Streptosporangiaceae bacterium]|nr:hypothetical protein [Streptosporangiaceae bacterium]